MAEGETGAVFPAWESLAKGKVVVVPGPLEFELVGMKQGGGGGGGGPATGFTFVDSAGKSATAWASSSAHVEMAKEALGTRFEGRNVAFFSGGAGGGKGKGDRAVVVKKGQREFTRLSNFLAEPATGGEQCLYNIMGVVAHALEVEERFVVVLVSTVSAFVGAGGEPLTIAVKSNYPMANRGFPLFDVKVGAMASFTNVKHLEAGVVEMGRGSKALGFKDPKEMGHATAMLRSVRKSQETAGMLEGGEAFKAAKAWVEENFVMPCAEQEVVEEEVEEVEADATYL